MEIKFYLRHMFFFFFSGARYFRVAERLEDGIILAY